MMLNIFKVVTILLSIATMAYAAYAKDYGYDIVVFKVDGVNTTTTKTTIRGELEIYGKYSNPTHIVVGIIYTDGTSIDRVVGVHIGNDKYRVVGNQHVYEVSRQ